MFALYMLLISHVWYVHKTGELEVRNKMIQIQENSGIITIPI